MALSITQQPQELALAQSPIIFTLAESNPALLTSSSFQYVGDLYYWTGSVLTIQGPSRYTIAKYPNNSGVGIFDLNRILNSTLTDLAQQNTSSVVAYAVDFYPQYLSGSTYLTGSHLTSSIKTVIDGYALFPTPIGANVSTQSVHWPIMTTGPATQSVFQSNTGNGALWTGEFSYQIYYSGSNGQNATFTPPAALNTTNERVKQFPMFPSSAGFPLSGSLDWYTVISGNGVLNTTYGSPIRFNLVCNQKYPNVRIKWKNQFGQFDWFNFNMVNRQSFQTEKKTYQPQLGTWESSTFSYNAADSANLNYIVDSKQTISVNTDWVDEDYNEIFKQLLVSDEIYWITNESLQTVKPITISTSNIQFKTGVVDKLIQYQFDFLLGQNYKLIM